MSYMNYFSMGDFHERKNFLPSQSEKDRSRYFQIKVISLGVSPFTFNDKTTMNTIELFLYLKFIIYESAHEKRVLIITLVTSKGSDEPAHKYSLARAFAVCKHVVDLEEASGKKCISVAQIGVCECIFEEPQTGKTMRFLFCVPA